jgi:hypothetical protein
MFVFGILNVELIMALAPAVIEACHATWMQNSRIYAKELQLVDERRSCIQQRLTAVDQTPLPARGTNYSNVGSYAGRFGARGSSVALDIFAPTEREIGTA